MNHEMGETIICKTVKENTVKENTTMNDNMKVSQQCRITTSGQII